MTNSVKIRHTQNAQERLKEAYKVLGISNTLTDQLNDIFNHWATVRISDKQVLKLIQQAMAPNPEVLQKVLDGSGIDEYSTRFNNTVEKISEFAFSHPTQQTDTTRGTLFGAYNAITGYLQNVKTFKNEEQKLKSILFGDGFNKANNAFQVCCAFGKTGDHALLPD